MILKSIPLELFETYINGISLTKQRYSERPVLGDLFGEFRYDAPEVTHVSQFLILATVHDCHGGLEQKG